MSKGKDLYFRMIERANRDNLPEGHELRVRAEQLIEIFQGPGLPPAPKIIGVWARARRAWCEYTGEPLL